MIALALTLAALGTIGLRLGGRQGSPDASPDASRATGVVRGTVWAFAALIVVEASLGFLGLLTARNVALLLVGVAAAVHWRAPRRGPGAARPPLDRLELALASTLAAAFLLLLAIGVHPTDYQFDSLSYHLHTTVTWMHARRLTIVPAVFGDTAPAYAPSNVELWFLSLMSPLRSEYLAGCGQIPLAGLAVASIVAAVREAGGERRAALAAGLAFLLIPAIWEQASTAMVDVGFTAFLLASVPLARRVEIPGCAAALGLAIGSKYVALVLAVPFLAFVVLQAIPHAKGRVIRLLVTGTAVVVATGGFWYLRNLLVTGNPIFPGAVPGLRLPALYDAAAMRQWSYHCPIPNVAVLVLMLAGSGVGFTTALVVAFARRPRHAEAVIAAAVITLFWIAIPYQQPRFLFPALGLAAMAIGRAASVPPPVLGWAPLVGAVVGGLIQGRPGQWLVLPAAAALGWFAGPLAARASRPTRVAVAAVAAAGLGVALVVGFGRFLVRDPPYGVPAWSWFRAHVRDTRVAYTGTNLGFPLAGARLGNEVFYVNVAGQPEDRLHDFARRLGAGPGTNPEPTIYRNSASFDVWSRNLRLWRARVLFVSTPHMIVRDQVVADAEGFPLERRWADDHPELFSLEYADPFARVYAIKETP